VTAIADEARPVAMIRRMDTEPSRGV
jgi:hypothetical protein